MQATGHDKMNTPWSVRLARESDIPALEKLIPLSVRGLSTADYSQPQIEGAIDFVMGVDRQLVRDGTYFVVDLPPSLKSGAIDDGELVGCGGWSKRQTLFGSDHHTTRDDAELNPATDPARIRAFFVHPDFARQGIARAILEQCEQAIRDRGFKRIELRATLPGEPFYRAHGYCSADQFEVQLKNGLSLTVIRMSKTL